MRIVLVGAGSRGDFQPMLALSIALRDAGHRVMLLGSPNFATEAAAFGIPFAPSGMDVHAYIVETRNETRSPLGLLRALNRMVRHEFHAQLEQIEPHLAGADLCVGGGAVLAASLLSEAHRVPYRLVTFTPQVLESEHHTPLMAPLFGLPRPLNRAAWMLVKAFYRRMIHADYQPQRIRRGLGPDPSIFDAVFPKERAIIACDPEVLPAPPDLSAIPQIGSFALRDERPLPADVEAFLAAGPPPVYVGFGSMPDDRPGRTTRLVCAAAKSAGVRVLLSSGWSGLGGEDLGSEVHVLGPVSHALLFPRVAGTVHHGGAGTVAASARAGVPQLVVPHGFDQFLFARAVHRRGLGPEPFGKTRLSVERLARALRALVSDEQLKANARAAGARIRARDPLTAAVRWLEGAASSRTAA